MTNSRSSTASASREKKDKRPFERLSLDEKDALKTLYAAKGHAVTASGGCDIARKLTHDPKLSATSQVSALYTGLLLEGWIILIYIDGSGKNYRYGVSKDYIHQLQPA